MCPIQAIFKLTVRRGSPAALLAFLALTARAASAQNDPDRYRALLASLAAADLPAPGTGVVIEQNEEPTNPNGPAPYQYLPDAGAFPNVSFTDESTGGTVSSHATQVGFSLYDLPTGVTQADIFNQISWLPNVLGVGSANPPAPAPSNSPAVANFSLIGNYYNSTLDNDAVRRFDYMIVRDNLVAVVAVSNVQGSPVPALMASSYNSIAVGLSNGWSSTGPVPAGDVDGPGRSKPDIVEPSGVTSYATPVVSAGAAMLVQVARSSPALSAGTNAAVIKAILMAGAEKNWLPSWSNTSTQPLDPQYGAGQLNFEWAYQIMAAGPQTACPTGLAASTGWSYSSLNPSGSAGNAETYYFCVPSGQPVDLSALLTWQRNVTFAPSGGSLAFTPSLATVDLNLYQASSSFTLGSLVASSSSSIDNVQYVFDRGLPAGIYALQVTRADSLCGAWPFALAWQLQNVPQWSAAADGSWNSAANWTSGVVPCGVGYEAFLGGPPQTTGGTFAGVSVTLDSPQTIGQLTLGQTTGGTAASSIGGYTISGGSAGTLTFSNSGSNALLTIQGGSHAISAPVILASNLTVAPALGAAVNISGNISETGGSQVLTVNGPGVLTLGGSNTFSGGAILSAGTLAISSAANLGSGGLVFNGGGSVLEITGSTGLTMNNGVDLCANGIIEQDASAPVDFAGSVSGSGDLIKSGSGLLILSGSISYTGETIVVGGTLLDLDSMVLSSGGLIAGAEGTTLFGGILSEISFSDANGSDQLPLSAESNLVPEPDTLALFVVAMGCAAMWRGRRQ
jgi:autotransporter-associated beta strand protein